MRGRGFRDLQVWELGVGLFVLIYKLTRTFPPDERFGLVSQLRSAAVSVSSNIAPGHGRGAATDNTPFLMNSKGSLNEVRSLLAVSVKLEIVEPRITKGVEEQADRIGRMLMGLRSS